MRQGNQTAVSESANGYEDTWNIGGSRFSLWASSAFDPDTYVGTTTVVPTAVLSIAPTYSNLAAGVGGTYAGAPGGDVVAAGQAAQNPMSLQKSPTPIVLGSLLIAVVGIHWLYYRERK